VAGGGVARRELGHAGVEGRQPLVAAHVGGPYVAAAVAPDELLQRLAVALEERRALALAVVGEHDEAIGPRRMRDGGGDRGDRPVDPAQHGQGVRALDARVMGHLVVGQERRVDDGAAGQDVRRDRRDLEVELDDRRVAASQERIFARLAPSPYSSPCPSEWRRSISAASFG
jgi:hypothetical protein